MPPPPTVLSLSVTSPVPFADFSDEATIPMPQTEVLAVPPTASTHGPVLSPANAKRIHDCLAIVWIAKSQYPLSFFVERDVTSGPSHLLLENAGCFLCA